MAGPFICDQCGEEKSSHAALMGHKNRRDHRQPAGSADETQGELPLEETAPAIIAAEEPPETAPRKPRLLERIRSRRGRGHGGQHQAPAPGERAPRRKRVGRRVALGADISDIWAFGGRRLESTAHYPTGRMLEYQAPAAGVIIDRAVAGTLPDRILFQPLARNRAKYEDVGFLLAGPLLTFSITTTGQQIARAAAEGDQDTYQTAVARLEVQKEMFRWVASMMLPRLAEGAKRAEEQRAKRHAAIADAFPDLGAEDPAEVFAAMLFQPPNVTEAPQNGKSDRATADTGREGSVSL